jgi:hypothetical protein
MASVDQILVENGSCIDKDSTRKYLSTLADNPEKIGELIEVLDQTTIDQGSIVIGDESRFLGLIRFLSHLRNPKTTLDDPFSEKVVNGRTLDITDEDFHKQLEIFMPDEGETQFVRFVFSDNPTHDYVMSCVIDEWGFDDYIEGEIREE